MPDNLVSAEQSEVLKKLNDIANWLTALRGEVDYIRECVEPKEFGDDE